MSCSHRILLTSVAALMPLVLPYDVDSWDRVLHAHVAPGVLEGIATHVVDYAAVASDPDFQTFVQSLEAADTSSLDKNETYALFMNAYNALAVKMIVDHPCKHGIAGRCEGPISSIRDIGSMTSSVWNMPAGKVGSHMYSLQQIEDFLRSPGALGEDSRLHSCIVCASISCPNLRAEAFRSNIIDQQMSAQMEDMLSNSNKGLSLDQSAGILTLSKIFFWYAGDFNKSAGSVVDFILPYVPASVRDFIANNKATLQLKYFDYDWDANGAPPCRCATYTTHV